MNLLVISESSKYWDTYNNCSNCSKNRTDWFHQAVKHPKDAGRMAISVNSDQTAPLEQSDLGMHCL